MILKPEEQQRIRQLLLEENPHKVLPDAVLQIIYKHKLFKLFLPEKLGGLEKTIPEAFKIIAEISAIDGDLGWAVQIGSGGGYFCGYFEDDLVKKYCRDEKFVISGSGFPGATAIPNEKGYLVNGSWKYCSGSLYASLFTAKCKLNGEDHFITLDPSQVKIIEDWNIDGLSNTSSHSISVTNAAISKSQCFQLKIPVNDYNYPLYYFPFKEYAQAVLIANVVGCFKRYVEEVKEWNQLNQQSNQQKSDHINQLCNEGWAMTQKYADLFYECLNHCWEECVKDHFVSAKQLNNFDLAMKNLVRHVETSSSKIFFAIGLSSSFKGTAMNKAWKDLATTCQHGLMSLV
jgi:alkylation response protein AidB-like acyl-CoA dehydrogenase